MDFLNRKSKRLMIFGILFFFVTALAAPALAQDIRSEVSGAGVVFDLFILRPVSLGVTAAGCVLFVASLPFTVWSGEALERAATFLVVEPGSFTFSRPLGEF